MNLNFDGQLIESRSVRSVIHDKYVDHGYGFVPTEYHVIFEFSDPRFRQVFLDARVTEDEYVSLGLGDLVGVDMYSDGRRWSTNPRELQTGKEEVGVGIKNPFVGHLLLSGKYG